MTRDERDPEIFVVIGMPRSGTTFLYHTLQSHPEVFVPYRKESYYFTANYHQGPEWFRSLYEGKAEGQIGAEINPMYFLDAPARERILTYDPNTKVILGVREPVSFLVSLHGNLKAHGVDVPPIAEMVHGYEWALTPEYSFHFELREGFLERSLGELRGAFGENLMIYDFGHFDRSPLAVLKALEEFLQIEPFFDEGNIPSEKINATGRRNLLFLNNLVMNQRLLAVLYGVLPSSAIRFLRRAYERLSSPAAASATAPGLVGEDERNQLVDYFRGDREFYEALFSDGPILMSPAAAR